MLGLHATQQRDQLTGCDSTHHTEFQLGLGELDESLGMALGRLRLLVDLNEMRAHHSAEFRQMRLGTLAMEKRSTELFLKLLDRTRDRRLRGFAAFGGTREVQYVGDCEKIANLMHFHGG